MNRIEKQATATLIVFLLLLLAFGILVFIYGGKQHAMQHGLTTPVQTKRGDGILTRG